MSTLKRILGSVIFCFILVSVHAQDTTKTTTAAPVIPPVEVKADSVKSMPVKATTPDSIKAAKPDTLKLATDTLKTIKPDSLNKLAADTLKNIKTDSLKTAKSDTIKTQAVTPMNSLVTPAPTPSTDNNVSLKTGWAVSLKAGTLGFGGEVVKELTKKFSARLGVNYYHFEKNLTLSDVNMDIQLKLLTYTLIADWYFVRFMHLSAGVAYNLNNIRLITSPGTSLKVGSYEVTPDELGSITTQIASNKFTPYVGIGFGRPISRNGRISFNTDLGILYMGGLKVEEFSSTGLIVSEPKGNGENKKQIESNLKGYSIHPVLSFQLSYKFIK